jgi:hypothetical protein
MPSITKQAKEVAIYSLIIVQSANNIFPIPSCLLTVSKNIRAIVNSIFYAFAILY